MTFTSLQGRGFHHRLSCFTLAARFYQRSPLRQKSISTENNGGKACDVFTSEDQLITQGKASFRRSIPNSSNHGQFILFYWGNRSLKCTWAHFVVSEHLYKVVSSVYLDSCQRGWHWSEIVSYIFTASSWFLLVMLSCHFYATFKGEVKINK